MRHDMRRGMRLFRLDDDHPFTGWHMLAVVGLFFGTIIAVNVAMAIAATGTFPGLVVKNSYVASQHYDELLDKAREQDRAGWRYALSTEGGVVRVLLSLGDSGPSRNLEVTAHAGRPSTTREDRHLPFVAALDGSYEAGEALPPGLWEVDVEARWGDDIVFRRTQEIFVRPPVAQP